MQLLINKQIIADFSVKCAVFIYVILLVPGSMANEILRATQPLYGISSMVGDLSNSSLCFKELELLKMAVDTHKNWGLKVLDVSGRPTSGFIYGNNLWIGNHKECLDLSNQRPLEVRHEKIVQEKTAYDFPPFDLAFAAVLLEHNSTLQMHVRQPLETNIQLGMCIPKSCLKEEIKVLLKVYFDQNILEFQKIQKLYFSVKNVRVLREDILWLLMMPKTIVLMALVGTVLLLTIIGTTIDVKYRKRQKHSPYFKNVVLDNGFSKTSSYGVSTTQLVNASSDSSLDEVESQELSTVTKFLRCFSFYSNVKSLFSTKLAPESIGSIHGLRFGGMGWVILVHTTYYQGDFANNPAYSFRLTEQFFAQIVSNSTYCVDTFLFISGFLLGYLFFKKQDPHNAENKQGTALAKLNSFFFMYLYRFFRLTPTYVIVILMCSVIHTFYKETSTLVTVEIPEVNCDQYWWRNLLYINNLYPRKEMCLSWSWYLSLDTQLYTIGSFLVILSTMYFKFASTVLIGLILVSSVVTAYVSYKIQYIPTLDDQRASLDAIYDLPWNRIGPYLVGIITAYFLLIRMKNQLTLKKRTRIILWTFFPLLNLWIIFTLYTRQIGVTFSAVYMGISRTLWGIGIAWIVVACSTNNARLLNKILCFKGFIPLSRLTYCAYLLNPLVVNMTSLGAEVGITGSISGFAINSLGVFMIAFLMSFLLSVLFESPFILLTKLILNKTSNNGGKKKSHVSTEKVTQGKIEVISKPESKDKLDTV